MSSLNNGSREDNVDFSPRKDAVPEKPAEEPTVEELVLACSTVLSEDQQAALREEIAGQNIFDAVGMAFTFLIEVGVEDPEAFLRDCGILEPLTPNLAVVPEEITKWQDLIAIAAADTPEGWAKIDAALATYADQKEVLSWAKAEGLQHESGAVRDLAASILEKTTKDLEEVGGNQLLGELYNQMKTDPHAYARFRAACALAAQGVHHPDVRSTLEAFAGAEDEEEEARAIARNYLDKWSQRQVYPGVDRPGRLAEDETRSMMPEVDEGAIDDDR